MKIKLLALAILFAFVGAAGTAMACDVSGPDYPDYPDTTIDDPCTP